MKVLFYGNQGNVGFRFTGWLRQKGIETCLMLQTNVPDERSKPEWEDPSVLNNCPPWMIGFKKNIYNWIVPERIVKNESKNNDIVLCTGSTIITALKLNKPVVFLPVGGDVTQLPFDCSNPRAELISFLYRRRINGVSRILTQQEDCIWAAKLLGTGSKIVRYPFPVDVRSIETNMDREFFLGIDEHYSKYDLVFFNPSRKNMDPNRVDYKGSEKLLRAFKRLIDNNTLLNVRLVLVMSGLHTEMFRSLVDELHLEKYCDFIDHLPLPRLHAYMSLRNVVIFDEFGPATSHVVGGIAREALSLGSIVVNATQVNSREFLEGYGPGCPILTANKTQEIYKIMLKLLDISSAERDEIKAASKLWANKYLHWESRIDELIAVMKDVITGERVNKQ